MKISIKNFKSFTCEEFELVLEFNDLSFASLPQSLPLVFYDVFAIRSGLIEQTSKYLCMSSELLCNVEFLDARLARLSIFSKDNESANQTTIDRFEAIHYLNGFIDLLTYLLESTGENTELFVKMIESEIRDGAYMGIPASSELRGVQGFGTGFGGFRWIGGFGDSALN